MAIRLSKFFLVAATALYMSLVVFNNVTDYWSNYDFVMHVLSMDTTFPENKGMWRAIEASFIHHAVYWIIIAWEAAAAVLCWLGAYVLLIAIPATARQFDRAKGISILGITSCLLLWFSAFITVGGEWFLMWQAKDWNGIQAAFRMFTIMGIILVYLTRPEAELFSNGLLDTGQGSVGALTRAVNNKAADSKAADSKAVEDKVDNNKKGVDVQQRRKEDEGNKKLP